MVQLHQITSNLIDQFFGVSQTSLSCFILEKGLCAGFAGLDWTPATAAKRPVALGCNQLGGEVVGGAASGVGLPSVRATVGHACWYARSCVRTKCRAFAWSRILTMLTGHEEFRSEPFSQTFLVDPSMYIKADQ